MLTRSYIDFKNVDGDVDIMESKLNTNGLDKPENIIGALLGVIGIDFWPPLNRIEFNDDEGFDFCDDIDNDGDGGG